MLRRNSTISIIGTFKFPRDDAVQEEARKHIAGYKVPRSVDFRSELPRLPTGKLYKRILRDEYWGAKDSKIV